ncbi:hypothetical protein [Paenibacillus sp. FSL L8-0708]|uniref:hypothetical protein n=1 Tax=Paenibacillus sp. FSL L8-0708 TaxID=2975311 RepID=UPI0030F9936D
MVQTAFERDSNVFLHLKTPDPYVDWLTQAREKLAVEARRVKNEAHRRGIKITSNQRMDGGILVRYQCRGYIGDIALPDGEVAKEAAGLMRRFLTL